MSDDLTQDDWNGVYYDRQAGEFFVFNILADRVTLIDAITGDQVETLYADEFLDAAENDDFDEVSSDVLRNPAETAANLLYEAAAAVNGDSTGLHTYTPVDVDFAITATNLSHDEDAPYHDRVE